MAKYHKGHVRRPDKDHLIALSHAKHGARLKGMRAVPLPAQWDSRAQGLIGPIKDQAQCGSCWDFSGTGCVEVAYNTVVNAFNDLFLGENGDGLITRERWLPKPGLMERRPIADHALLDCIDRVDWRTGGERWAADKRDSPMA